MTYISKTAHNSKLHFSNSKKTPCFKYVAPPSTEPDEEVEVGEDSDESEPSQPSFKHLIEVFRAASENPVQTSSVFSATAKKEADFFDTLIEFFQS